MKWLVIAVGTFAGLLAAMAAVGATRPRGHVATRSARFRQSAETLWSTIADHASAATWRSDVRSIEMLPAIDGHVMFREETSQGKTLFRVEASEPARRLVTRIADESLPYGGAWTIELVPDGDTTRVTITENGEVKNVIFRFISMFLDQHATIDGYLRSLGRKYGETVTLEGA